MTANFKNIVDDFMKQEVSPLSEVKEFCAMDAFFEKEKQKPEHLRQRGACLVCNCPKCRRCMSTLCSV